MSVFADSEQLYTVAGELFARVAAENPRAAAQLLRARMLIRIVCTGPSAEIWIQARKPPLETHFGHQRLNAELEVQMEADILHEILTGHLHLGSALAGRKLEVRGQVWKAKALADLFEQSQSLYPHVLRAQGITWPGAAS
jgi:hypothetical protein